MKCPKCGKEVDSNLKVCPYCGEKLEEETVTTQLEDIVSSVREDNSPKVIKKEEDLKTFIFHLLAYLSLICGVLGGFFGLIVGLLGLVSSFRYKEAKQFRQHYVIASLLGIIWIVVILVLLFR